MKLPDFFFEKKVYDQGYKYIGGADEVGRGALAGPVFAGCVVYKRYSKDQWDRVKLELESKNIKINDSKKLTQLQRERAYEWIKNNALSYGIGWTGVGDINKKGINKASYSAYRRAVAKVNLNLPTRVEYLLIDAYYVPYICGIRRPKKSMVIKGCFKNRCKKHYFSGNQMAIIKGDERSFTIASASIIAKVERDYLMRELCNKSARYKKYEWDKNKGYGTLTHRQAIIKYGTTRLHREKFLRNILSLKS